MKVKYTGEIPVLLMTGAQVWRVEPGDEIALPEVPPSAAFEASKKKGVTATDASETNRA